ncbi:hypothetical protein [Acetobacter aceti]|uniref:hypothetical protein n=1 Tax=Acetobacter aceti TaxID=435 RepID=UPI000C08D31F|nr:hypothetical protein [Acetobacter aceti]
MLFGFSACRWIALALLIPLLSGAARSRDIENIEGRLKRLVAALKDAEASTQPSSSLVPIAGQGLLEVPEGTRFVPAEQTRAFLESVGHAHDVSIMGMIIPQNFYMDPDWMVSFTGMTSDLSMRADSKIFLTSRSFVQSKKQ